MTNNGYLGLGLFIGTVIGAGAGVAITYFSMKKKCDAKIQEEIDSFKEEYKEGYGRRYPHFEALDTGGLEDDIDHTNAKHHKTIAASSIDGGPVDIQRTDYHKIASNYKKNLDDVIAESESPMDDDEEEEIGEGDGSGVLGDIYIMSTEEFNTSDYDSCNLIYYPAEGSLFEGDEEIDNADVLVGSCLEGLDIPEGKEGVIFIRNEKLHMDYEIDVLWDTYETNDE